MSSALSSSSSSLGSVKDEENIFEDVIQQVKEVALDEKVEEVIKKEEKVEASGGVHHWLAATIAEHATASSHPRIATGALDGSRWMVHAEDCVACTRGKSDGA